MSKTLVVIFYIAYATAWKSSSFTKKPVNFYGHLGFDHYSLGSVEMKTESFVECAGICARKACSDHCNAFLPWGRDCYLFKNCVEGERQQGTNDLFLMDQIQGKITKIEVKTSTDPEAATNDHIFTKICGVGDNCCDAGLR